MIPQLPPAVHQRILDFAIPPDHRRPRQQLRRQLSLVCRAWHAAIAFGRDVDVLSVAQLARLRDQLADARLACGLDAPDEARRGWVRAAYLKLRKVPEEEEGVVGEFLGLCTGLEELTIELNGGDRSLLRVDGVRNGLGGLRMMRRFTFLGLDPQNPASPAAPLSKHSMQT